MKILNLYAGIGGNRKLWGDGHEITAIEYDEATAETYKSFFPNDNVIVTDAHEYLLKNYMNFDFIWSSPPCPSHSRINFSQVREIDYPDMRLYQEIILLQSWYNGRYCVENVIPYYIPLIPAKEIDRHLFWSNFKIAKFTPSIKAKIRMQGGKIPFEDIFGINIDFSRIKDKRKALRKCVHPETGLHILNCAISSIKGIDVKQENLFESATT